MYELRFNIDNSQYQEAFEMEAEKNSRLQI